MPNELHQHLAEKVAGLNPDARRAVYDRARAALQTEVRASAPFMPVQTVVARRRELENAIMAVEREAASNDPPRPLGKPAQPEPVEAPPPVEEAQEEEARVEETADELDALPLDTEVDDVTPAAPEPSPPEPLPRAIPTPVLLELARLAAMQEILREAPAAAGRNTYDDAHEEGALEAPQAPRRPLAVYLGVAALILCAVVLAVILVGFAFEPARERVPAQAVLPPPRPEAELIKGAGFQDAAQAALREGNALLARRDYGRAIAAFDDAIRLDPKNAAAFGSRAFAHGRMGNIDAAIRDHGVAIERDPANATHRLNRAIAYNRQGEYRRAADDLDSALAADPANANALNSRCWARAMLAHLEEALSDCNEALKLVPEDADALDSRGFVFLRLGRLDRAIADYSAALKLQPKLAGSLYGRGLARIGRGDRAGGNEDIAAARAVNPDIAATFARYGIR